MKIVTVLGARPQFIKASVVSHALTRRGGVSEVVVHTGQHFDANMSDVFFNELGMTRPAYELGVHGGHHGEMTGRMLVGIERILIDERPDIVLVYGDTNSTLAGALAAAKLDIPIAHVEAGLRSFNMRMPEEINRILTDRVSQWLFAPTIDAVRHLVAEGTDTTRIHEVGDVMYDVALHHGGRSAGRVSNAIDRLGLAGRGYLLATVHRAENTDNRDRLAVIVDAFCAISRTLPVVWPVHPRTRRTLEREGLVVGMRGDVRLLDPLGYLDMLQLERSAAVIATDSGGVQKEAFFHGVPCVTLRDETEWVELIDAGWNRLAPPRNVQHVIHSVTGAIGSSGTDLRCYGDGAAAEKIVDILVGGARLGAASRK